MGDLTAKPVGTTTKLKSKKLKFQKQATEMEGESRKLSASSQREALGSR